MEIVVDSHVLFWWLDAELHHKLSPTARTTLESATKIYISVIVLLELLSLFEKYDQADKFSKLFQKVKNSALYHIVPLSLEIVHGCAQLSSDLELHDRVIVATAQKVDGKLISKDRVIQDIFPETIW